MCCPKHCSINQRDSGSLPLLYTAPNCLPCLQQRSVKKWCNSIPGVSASSRMTLAYGCNLLVDARHLETSSSVPMASIRSFGHNYSATQSHAIQDIQDGVE